MEEKKGYKPEVDQNQTNGSPSIERSRQDIYINTKKDL